MTHLERLKAEGIRRLGSKERGFHYRSAQGDQLSTAQAERIRRLRIPPAWTEVFIHPSEHAHLQAVGKDAKGRWQYRYHPRFLRAQQARKYERLEAFAHALPALRRTVAEDLARRGLPREKVMACILQILSTCFLRPGSQVYAAENGSYGLATLRNRHVRVRGDEVRFSFPGKSGQHQERALRDRRVARIVRALLKVPGKEVFKWVEPDGTVVDVRRRHINQYIKDVMGDRFSAKDFRTWAGTLICASALARAGARAEDDPPARKKKVVAAVKETAQVLGNTPAVCRASYIYPPVLSSFDRGRVVRQHFDDLEELVQHRAATLHGCERALLELLRDRATHVRASAARRRRLPRRKGSARRTRPARRRARTTSAARSRAHR